MFNTTVELAGYTSDNKENGAIRVIRINRTHIVDAEAFSPAIPNGRAMSSISTVRDTRLLWHDDIVAAEACVAEALPTRTEEPVNEVMEQVAGLLIEQLGGMEPVNETSNEE